jgi:acetate kinase
VTDRDGSVLVVNAGSSSLKLRLLGPADATLARADLPADADGFREDALAAAISDWPRPDAVGHRVVHGGTRFTGPERITDEVAGALRDLTALAPLHQPKSLAGVDAVSRCYPDVPAVACFDTAFHASIPPAAHTYAIPAEWRQRYAARRFGFHGLSHAYASRCAAGLAGRPVGELRIVSCHLGAGASACAIVDGTSVDTTMGFTPLDGLVMSTRSGAVDPGLLLWLEEHERLRPHEVASALEHRSGLLALAGSAEWREVETWAAAGDGDAQLAIGVYVHRLVAAIAAMTAAAGGLDALVFTGGVGEHSAGLRDRAASLLGWLGVAIDAAANQGVADGQDAEISSASARVSGGPRTFVIAAREDLEIARETRATLGA